jgi:hypothetical protein
MTAARRLAAILAADVRRSASVVSVKFSNLVMAAGASFGDLLG